METNSETEKCQPEMNPRHQPTPEQYAVGARLIARLVDALAMIASRASCECWDLPGMGSGPPLWHGCRTYHSADPEVWCLPCIAHAALKPIVRVTPPGHVGLWPSMSVPNEAGALKAENSRLRAGLKAVEDLMAASYGVAGLHLNGDVAPWDSLRTGGRFEDWLLALDGALMPDARSERRRGDDPSLAAGEAPPPSAPLTG